ncbi:uncharacterized protein IAS62_004735 [Cryptococcus decagattii]|uniref:beta-glucosidase n=1 Tax=Cryptococcus decagattii TaxID=1859122 RepID=A0ABZ2AXY0_9TREE
MKLGSFPSISEDATIDEAVALAKESDTVVLVVGLDHDWESESYDRPNLSLPLRLNELVHRVATEAPNANKVSARTKTDYEEGIWVGYRHFTARGIKPMYAFGHGLSYTEFGYSDLQVLSSPSNTPNDWRIRVSAKVTNTDKVAGAHSVHFYVTPPPPTSNSLLHPEVTLQAFTKTGILPPGGSEKVSIEMDKFAISHWDELTSIWRAESGSVVVPSGFKWTGL